MKSVRFCALLLLTLCAGTIIAAEPDEILPGSVNDIMVTIITQATNTIWSIEDPQSDEEWQVFVDAALQLVDASTRIKTGGKGPNDSGWAEDPQWQRFANVLIASGQEIQVAAREHNLDAVIEISNDKMYPPCEECHIMFHPGMQP